MTTMDIGSTESLRSRVIELQKTLTDVGVTSLPILHDEATGKDHRGLAMDDVYLVTPEQTLRIPFQDPGLGGVGGD